MLNFNGRLRPLPLVIGILFLYAFLRNFEGLGFDESYGWRPTFLSASALSAGDEYVAVCIAVRNQARDLPEFLLHHYHHHRIRRFYIMDDGSKPPLSTFDYPVPDEAISFRYFAPNFHQTSMQLALYDACIAEFADKHTWMAFFDTDEFLETRSGSDLHSLLEKLEMNNTIGALAISTKTHSSAGRLTRRAYVRSSYDKCIVDPQSEDPAFDVDNKLVKSIVKTAAYARPMNTHQFAFKDNRYTVGENLDVLLDSQNGQRWPITREKIVLHHYATKSKEEFQEKMDRWNSSSGVSSWEYFDRINGLEQTNCTELTQYDP